MRFLSHPLMKKVLRNQVIIIGIAAVISVVQGGLDLANIGSYWALIGLAMLVFALMSVFGGGTSMRTPQYQMMLSLSRDSDQRVSHMAEEMNSARFFLINTFGNAMVAIVGGLILFFGLS